MNIYIWRDDEQYGPYTEAQARIYLNEGHLDPDDQARTEGGRWMDLERIIPPISNVSAAEHGVASAVGAEPAEATELPGLPADYYPDQQQLALDDPRKAATAKLPAKRIAKKTVWVSAREIRREVEASPAPAVAAIAEEAAASAPVADEPAAFHGEPPPPLDDVPQVVPDYPRPEWEPAAEMAPTDLAPEPDYPRPELAPGQEFPEADYTPEPDAPHHEPASEFVPEENPPEFPPAPARPPERSPYGLIFLFLAVVAILDSTVAFFYFSHKPVPIVPAAEVADSPTDSVVLLPPEPSPEKKPAPANPSAPFTSTLSLANPPAAEGPATNLTFAVASSTNAESALTKAPAAPNPTPPAPATSLLKTTAPTTAPTPPAEVASSHFLAPTNSLAPPPDQPAPSPAIPVEQLATAGGATASAPKPTPSAVPEKKPAPSAQKPSPAVSADDEHPAAKKGAGHSFDADAIMKASTVREGFGTSFDTGKFNSQFVGHTFTFTGEVTRLNEKEGLVVFRGGGGYPDNWDLQLQRGKFSFEPNHKYHVVFRLLDVKTPPFSGYSFRGKVLGKSHA